jgi:hypothetical protein
MESMCASPSSRDDAIEQLSQRLHWTMERMDPTDDPEWESLNDHQRAFYRACVRDLLTTQRDLVLKAAG